ncbi:hypothetical protein ITI46_31510 [Streptomyces oryzae]|uniref:ATP-binding protein n=1 Tax=Streptomyces oryzae TaxID=1434886 RepID=A0ABS3XL52_9ACTN|nr:hypothetical protein [Streptomyces oryzae]MBO8196136.1 hypothetical protein [Streptomyces oryzae]
MKQVAKKSLGVAAMSAAAVVSGAGAASALPVDTLGVPTGVLGSEAVKAGGRALGPAVETTGKTAGKTLGGLPLEEATRGLPANLSEPVGVAQEALAGTLSGTPVEETTERLADRPQQMVKGKSSKPGGGMIGGLPLGKALPIGGSH